MPTVETKLPDAFYQGRLLNVEEACQLLGGVSRDFLYTLMDDKKDPLPSVKIRRSRFFQLDKILWWIEKHQQ